MIRIITDSAADFEPQELARLNIASAPLSVRFQDGEYLDNVTLTKPDFYDKLISSGEMPTTSQPAPQHLLEQLDLAQAAGDEVIVLCLSSAISGTYQTALMTCADFDNVRVIDTRNATGGERMVVEYAAALRDQGASLDEIVEKVNAMLDRVVLYACMDTLEYLYRGGRISQTAYTLGSLAQVKPIIRVEEDGRIGVPAKAMGTKKGLEILCKRLTLQEPDPAFPIYVMFTSHRSVGEALAQKLRDMGYAIPDQQIIQVGAVIGTHVGPKACGVVYVAK